MMRTMADVLDDPFLGGPFQSQHPSPLLRDDADPQETGEWLEALESVMKSAGRERALFLLQQLEQKARDLNVVVHVPLYSAYQNTISLEQQCPYPGDLAVE